MSIDVLAETIQTLDVRRAELRGELAALDEAISLLRRIRIQPAPVPTKEKLATAPLPRPMLPLPAPRPLVCTREGCGKTIPPMPPHGGRPRIYCSKACNKKATYLRAHAAAAPAPPADDEDPTDAALRRHRELNPVPESASGMRSRRAR